MPTFRLSVHLFHYFLSNLFQNLKIKSKLNLSRNPLVNRFIPTFCLSVRLFHNFSFFQHFKISKLNQKPNFPNIIPILPHLHFLPFSAPSLHPLYPYQLYFFNPFNPFKKYKLPSFLLPSQPVLSSSFHFIAIFFLSKNSSSP